MLRFSKFVVLIILWGFSICNGEQSLWDSQRYIDIDELKPGMTGYGLTVFKGTQIEQFEVELISVMERFEPGRNAFLIMCHDPRFDLAKGTQGVSGSPVYFKNRLAGAMSFGWSFGEEPLYGVTPIREMLTVKKTGNLPSKYQSNPVSTSISKSFYANLLRPELASADDIKHFVAGTGLTNPISASGRYRLPLAVNFSEFHSRTIQSLTRLMPGISWQAVSGGSITDIPESPVTLQPGSSMIIPLSMGDINATLLGTVTEVRGNSVWGFGHSWNGNGQVNYPLGTATIHSFVNSKNMSFKLGSLLQVQGALRADESTAVYGLIGAQAPATVVDLSYHWAYNDRSQDFHYKTVRSQQFTPIFVSAGALAAADFLGGLPDEVTLTYNIDMQFSQLGNLTFTNISSGRGNSELFEDTMAITMTVLSNPWKRVDLEKVSIQMEIDDQNNVGYLVSTRLNKLSFKPGECIQAVVELEPDYGSRKTFSSELKLPSEIKPGHYQLKVGSRDSQLQSLALAKPWLKNPLNAEGVIRALKARQSLRRDRLYMSLVLNDEGIAPEGRPLPGLPKSQTVLIEDEKRQVESFSHKRMISSQQPTPWVFIGDAVYEIEVEPAEL